MKLLEELKKEFDVMTLLTYARSLQEEAYLGNLLFPEKQIKNFKWEYFKGSKGLPVMATVQAWGAETPIHSREGIEKLTGGIVPIKRKIYLDEEMLVALRREGLGDKEMVSEYIFNDLARIVSAVQAREEKLKMDALVYGKNELNENNVVQTVDYQRPADNEETLLSTSKWSDLDDSDPIENIQEWSDYLADSTGIRPTRAVTSSSVVAFLRKNATIRKMINGDTFSSVPITVDQINTLLSTMNLPKIGVYDKKARVQNADGSYTTFNYLPTDRFILLPPNTLGEHLVGPTAEALLDFDVPNESASGIYANFDQDFDPPGIVTKVAKAGLPTFPEIDTVFVATVI